MEKLNLEKVRELVSLVLEKTFPNDTNRRKMYLSGNRLSFCCPYCGDGKDPKKKRGNLYIDSLSFKCWNGGCGIYKDFLGFLNDHDLRSNLTIEEIEECRHIIDDTYKNHSHKLYEKIDVFILNNYKDIIISRDYYKKKLNLMELPGPIEKYLEKRNQEVDERYLYSPQKKSLHILNLTSDKKYILGLQLRNMNKKATNKYFTYRLSGIYKKLFFVTDNEIIKKAEELDPISTIFGFSFVDLDQDVTIFEGPFDSFLFKNSVGICSINNKFPFDINNKRWFFDGDKSGRDELTKKLEEGETVFMWKKFIEDNRLPERDKWDWNDVVDYVRLTGHKIERPDKYFTNDKWDMIHI